MPERIQLRRTKGWRKPAGAVVVSRPSRWGNPYRWSDYPSIAYDCDGEPFAVSAAARRRHAVVDFKYSVQYGVGALDYPSKDEIRRELAGRDLACWCPLPEPGQPDHCHAAVLISIANEEVPDA